MTLVVDASVALKWVLDEEGSAEARALPGAERLLAPEFLVLECANVLALRARRGGLTADNATEALAVITSAPVRLTPFPPHVAAAQRIAWKLERTTYDALYLAVALAEGAVLVTADVRFARAAAMNTEYAAAVRLLGNS